MPEPMSEERLAEITARHAAATEGPWWFDESANCWRLHGIGGRMPSVPSLNIGEQTVNKQILKAPKHGTPYAEYWPDPEDAELIVNAWVDERDLLAEVKRLRAEARLSLGPSLYMEVQQVLDAVLGTEENDGAGAGIVADVQLVAERLLAAEAELTLLRGAEREGGR